MRAAHNQERRDVARHNGHGEEQGHQDLLRQRTRRQAGNYEVEMGTPLLEPAGNRGRKVTGGKLKAVIPGGSSVPILPADKCEGVNLDYESCQAAGTMVGSGGYMAFNEKTDIVLLMRRTSEFYAHESCGKCTRVERARAGWSRSMIASSPRRASSDIDLLEYLRANRRAILLRAGRCRRMVRSGEHQTLP